MYWLCKLSVGSIECRSLAIFQIRQVRHLELLFYDRNALKKVTPNAEAWIPKHFGGSFKLRKGSE